MTRAARYERHVGLAATIARDYRVPGLDPDDVHQEARVALWIATGSFDPARGIPFGRYAGVVIRRRLVSVLRSALRPCHAVLTYADRDEVALRRMVARVDVERTVVDRDELRQAVEHRHDLSPAARRRRQWRESKQRARERAAA